MFNPDRGARMGIVSALAVVTVFGGFGTMDGFSKKTGGEMVIHPFDWETKPVLYLAAAIVSIFLNFFACAFPDHATRWGSRALTVAVPAIAIAGLFYIRGAEPLF